MSAQTDDFVIWNEKFLVAYLGSDAVVTIPEGVTQICNYAFALNTAVQEIIVPEGVEVVDDYTFTEVTSLTHLDLPSTLTKFGGFPGDTKKTIQSNFVATVPEGSVAIKELEFGKYKLAYELK